MSRMATRSLTEFFSTVLTCALGGGHEKWQHEHEPNQRTFYG